MTRQSPDHIALEALVSELEKRIGRFLVVPRVWFSEKAAAEYMNLSVHSLRAWRSRPRSGPDFHRVNGRIIYHRDDLDAWIREHRVKG